MTTTNLQKWGNSQGIRIPKLIIDAVNWKENEELTLDVRDDEIIIRKAKERKSIEELFQDFDGTYSAEEIDWGKPVGKEIW